MTFQDYHARAELFLGSDRHTALAQGGRSFATAAQAIRFAFEEAAPVSLRGAMLKIGNATFEGADLTTLYRDADYPLPRKGDIKRSRARRARPSRRASVRAPSTAAALRQPAMA